MQKFPIRKRAILRILSHAHDKEKDTSYSAQDIAEMLSPLGSLKYFVNKVVSDLEDHDQQPVNEEDRIITARLRSGPVLNVQQIEKLLDELVQDGYLECDKSSVVRYRRIRKPIPWPIEEVRRIANTRSAKLVISGYAEEGAVIVDQITASLLIKVYDNLGANNQDKFAKRDVIEATHLAWKLVEKRAISMSFH